MCVFVCVCAAVCVFLCMYVCVAWRCVRVCTGREGVPAESDLRRIGCEHRDKEMGERCEGGVRQLVAVGLPERPKERRHAVQSDVVVRVMMAVLIQPRHVQHAATDVEHVNICQVTKTDVWPKPCFLMFRITLSEIRAHTQDYLHMFGRQSINGM
jgi:hypothetical protein